MAPDDLHTHVVCHSEKSGRGGTARAIARFPQSARQKGRTHVFARTETPVPSRDGCGWQVLLLALPKRPDRPSTPTRLRGKAGCKLAPTVCRQCHRGARQAAARFRRSPRRPVRISEPRAAEVWLFRRQFLPSTHLASRAPLRRQKEPDAIHPHGHVPFGGLAIASCAPWPGTQYEPLAAGIGQLRHELGFGVCRRRDQQRGGCGDHLHHGGFVSIARPIPSRGGKLAATCSLGHYWDAGGVHL
jgi:hypothetical protein